MANAGLSTYKTKDFAISQLASGGMSSTATEIPLVTGGAAKFANGPSIVVVYDDTDYPNDPAGAEVAGKLEKIVYKDNPDTTNDKLKNLVRGVDGTTARDFLVSGHKYVVMRAPIALDLEALDTVFNVKAHRFGAVGDGVANDTAAIQAAIDATTGGGEILLPGGTYLSGALTLGDNISLIGAGRNFTTIKANAAVSVLSATLKSHVRVANLTLDGNSLGVSAISWTSIADSVIERLRIINFTSHPIDLLGASGVHTEVKDCRITVPATAGVSVRALRSSAGSALRLKNNYFAAATAKDVLVDVVGTDGVFSQGNILDTATVGFKTGSDFTSIGDWFSTVTTPYQVAANFATIIGPRGVTEAGVDTATFAVDRKWLSFVGDDEVSFGDVDARRFRAKNATAYVPSDFTLTGWGTGPTVSVNGTDSCFSISVVTGTGPSANPTIDFNFKDGAWATTPVVIATRLDAEAGSEHWKVVSVSTTACSLGFVGTPSGTRGVAVLIMGRA